MKKVLFGIFFGVISLTGGIIMTSIGLIVTVALNIAKLFNKKLKIKTHINGCSLITEVGGDGGGLELGAVALCGNYSESNNYGFELTRCHEFGHALQHLILGPLFIFVVAIPSACRYWYQRIMGKKGKHFAADGYDSVWFEGTATSWGTKVINGYED